MLCDIFISFYLLLYKHKSTFKDLLNHFPLCVALTTRIHELAFIERSFQHLFFGPILIHMNTLSKMFSPMLLLRCDLNIKPAVTASDSIPTLS